MVQERRRITDSDIHSTPCPILTDYISISEQIHTDLQAIKSTQISMLEMLEAFKNAKGFIKTIQVMGELAKWMMAIGTLIAAFYLWMRK